MSRTTMNARDLFLSHSSGDAEVARQLRTVLEASAYSCWMAPDDIVGTETWTEQILSAIHGSRAMVVLVSANANQSPHVSREVNLALGRKRPVLPIRIENVPPEGSLEYLLSLVQRVDAFPPPITDHGERITKRLDALLRPNATPPPPPAPDAKTKVAGKTQPDTEPAEPKRGRRTTRRRAATPKPRVTGPIGPGSVIDDFTLETLLGEGGMGRVYRARQSEPDRAVALKVIRPDHAADDTYRQRFLAEKNTLAGLEHPSIVPIYAAGQEDDVLYIAMRLIDGSDLQARITAQGHLSLRETVQVLQPIADAIDHAHAAGVIHRDLKPSNIILDRHGRPYLTDFGLGKHVEQSSQLSTPGVALGTLDYMAPEQFTGSGEPALANRIDVYALGCVAYACLTGRTPFVRDTPQQLMYAHSHDAPPSARSIRPELPQAVDDVLAKALAKDPAQRLPTATALIAGLQEAFLSSSTGQTRPVIVPTGTSGARGWLRANTPLAVIGSSLAAVAIVVLGALTLGGGPGPSIRPTGPIATPFVPTPDNGDTTPPSGGAVAIVPSEGLNDLVTTLAVTIDVTQEPVDDSGITGMLVANAASRPAIADALPYADSFAWTLATGDGKAGPRNVFVWFGDRLGNWTEQPVQTSIGFDNPPEPINDLAYDRTAAPACKGETIELDLLPYLATDPDGADGLEIVRVWTGAPAFAEAKDLSGSIKEGKKFSVRFTDLGTTQVRLTDYFTVADAQGVERDGYFFIDVGPAC